MKPVPPATGRRLTLPRGGHSISKRMRIGAARWTVGLATLLVCASASAQYPVPRANRERTGRVTTPIPAQPPRPIWRSFVGGLLGAGSPAYIDAGGDGTTDLLLLAGGVINAKRPSDIETWAAGAFDLRLLVGTFDLDGDGVPEAVAIGEGGRLVVISATTGDVLFDESVVGGIGAGTRVRDLDGDGLLDLYVPGAGCGAFGNNDGVALSFSAGAANPVELWRLEPIVRDHDCGNYDVFVDLEGDGIPEIVALGHNHVYAFDSTSGEFRFDSDAIGLTPYGLALCSPVDVQGDGDEELVCFSNSSYQPAFNARRTFVLDYDTGRDVIELVWSADVADLVADRNAFVAESVSDFDSDGSPEVVHSFFDGASETWTTFIRDGASGAEIDSVDGGWVVGLVDLDEDGRKEILVSDEAGLEAFRFEGSLASLWRLEGLKATRVIDRSTLSVNPIRDRLAHSDTDDGPALVFQHESAPGEIDSLHLIRRSAVDPAELGRYDVPATVVVTRFAALDGSTDPDGVFVAATSESRLITFDAQLRPTNRIEDPKFPVLGARYGGDQFLASGLAAVPLAADADGDGTSELVLADARNRVSLVDARDASLTREPIRIWSVARAGFAAFFDDPTGPGLGTVLQTTEGVEARDSTGAALWSTDLLDSAAGDRFYRDLLPFPLAGGGDGILLYRLPEGSGVMEANVLSGTEGSPLWPDWVPIGFASGGTTTAAIADLDADGQGEIITSPGGPTLSAYDGSSGSLERTRDGPGLLLPVVVDIELDGSPEVLETGYQTMSAVDASFTELWRIPGETQLRNYGALARCPGATWLTGLTVGPTLRAYDLEDGSLLREVVLAGGDVFDDLGGAVAAGRVPGFVRAVTVAPSALDPDDEIVLVGSSDGHLYALGACELDLRWSVAMGGGVNTAVPADTDGDGEPEIIVAVADGYVHALGIPRVDPPGLVLDTDPPSGIVDQDVDEIETFDTLYAVWDGTEGTVFEVSVVTSDLAPVTDGFVPVGASTDATLGRLDLRVGVRYIVAVRARDGDEVSPESVSDGVVVVDRTGPQIEITADPDSIRGGSGAESVLTVHASDRRGLAHVSVEVHTPDGSMLEILLDGDTSGPTFDWSSGWDALDENGDSLPTGIYEAVATAIDVAGAEASATATVEVLEETDSRTWFARGNGCACRSAGGGSEASGDSFLALAAIAALASTFSRRRTCKRV